MQLVSIDDLKSLYIPPSDSHKGQNGKLLIIGGSKLFHAASLWALAVASRIVDLVHYSSVPENNLLVQNAKEEFRNGIVVTRDDIENYIEEDDVVLIGPGMTRDDETRDLTNSLLQKYPQKQWVIDAGALQMLDITHIPKNAILTPHQGEFDGLWEKQQETGGRQHDEEGLNLERKVSLFALDHQCIVLVKGQKDMVVNGITEEIRVIEGGNAGMTKGGTGDVLAGLIAALACKNDPWLAIIAGSFINKKAGDALYEKVGPYFNASDLANQIPLTMKSLLL